jgi:hypothetical protein
MCKKPGILPKRRKTLKMSEKEDVEANIWIWERERKWLEKTA